MIKNNEKLNEFIANFMSEFSSENGIQLSNGFTPHHILRAISGQFMDDRMTNADLSDYIMVGFSMAFAAYKTLNGSEANEDGFKEMFKEYLEMLDFH